jgi:ElaB/YqjD/DUF883 family membrane-anchored ribosome-binding protein
MSAKKEKQSATSAHSTEEGIAGSPGGVEEWGQGSDDDRPAGVAGPLDEGTQEAESTVGKTISDAVNNAAEAVASSTAGAGEALGEAGRAATEGAAKAASQAYTVGTEATHVVERQMSERPWMTLLAGTFLGCVLGFMLASRRQGRRPYEGASDAG